MNTIKSVPKMSDVDCAACFVRCVSVADDETGERMVRNSLKKWPGDALWVQLYDAARACRLRKLQRWEDTVKLFTTAALLTAEDFTRLCARLCRDELGAVPSECKRAIGACVCEAPGACALALHACKQDAACAALIIGCNTFVASAEFSTFAHWCGIEARHVLWSGCSKAAFHVAADANDRPNMELIAARRADDVIRLLANNGTCSLDDIIALSSHAMIEAAHGRVAKSAIEAMQGAFSDTIGRDAKERDLARAEVCVCTVTCAQHAGRVTEDTIVLAQEAVNALTRALGAHHIKTAKAQYALGAALCVVPPATPERRERARHALVCARDDLRQSGFADAAATCDKLLRLTTSVHAPCSACGKVSSTGPFDVCSRCRTVQYCNTRCQASHWPEHKRQCKLSTVRE